MFDYSFVVCYRDGMVDITVVVKWKQFVIFFF